jgi:TolA-binding protein
MRAPRSANLEIIAAKKEKRSAPNLEDHADYFSESRSDASSQDLKKADEIRVKTINSIKKLVSDQKTRSPRNFELLLRLGELHVERHDYIRDLEADAYSRAWKAWEAKPENQRGAEPKLTYRIANQELAKAANAFRRLVAEFPRHPRTDSALFALAKTLGRLNDDNAESYYNQLIKAWPKSPLIPEAHLALAEFHFEKHNMPKAMAGYKAAMQFKEHPAYPYAVYKLGWAYYNSDFKDNAEQQENYKKSITAFKLVIKLADSRKGKGNLDLKKEAIRDLVLVWAETEDVDGAWKYFRTIGEEAAFYTMLERLGNIYADQGKNDKAIETFERLNRESPARLSAPDVQIKLVELFDLTSREADAAATLRGLPETFKPKGKWASANAKNPEDTARVWTRIEKLVHRWGTLYHNRGQKSKNQQLVNLAATVYETYLNHFAESAAAYEIRFYLAEIQFDQDKHEAAASNYSIVANSRPKDGKFKRAAALNAVAAMNKQVETGNFGKLPAPGKVVPRSDIPREKQLLIRYMDDYARLLPNDPEGYPMRYTVAATYMQYGQLDEGMKRLNAIITAIPGTPQGRAAITLVIGHQFEKKDWSAVITAARRIDGIKDFTADANIMKVRNSLFAQALFNRALDFEKAGDYNRAATDYLAFQQEFPRDPGADRALYNASLAFSKAARPEDSMSAGRRLLDSYPQSKLRVEVMADLGQTSEALADFGTAAKWYMELARTFPNDKRSPHAMFNAAVLSKALGRLDQSESLFAELRRMWPHHDLMKEATVELAMVQEKRERYIEAATTYAALAGMKGVDADTQMLALTRKAKILALKVKESSARHDLDRIRMSLGRKDAPVALQARQELAETLFSQVDGGFQQFMAARINAAGSAESQIQAKQGILERVAAGYEAVIAIGSPEHTVASLYRLGEMHEDFAEKLFNVQPSAGKNPEQALSFRSKMDKLAFPLKEEAAKFYEVAQKRSAEVETFSVWTSKVEAKIAELGGRKTGSDAMMVLSPNYISQRFALNKATRELID